jgi:hypothetical protein
LADEYRKDVICLEVLSSALRINSYVSLEYALCDYDWIHRDWDTITCVTSGSPLEIQTTLKCFSFVRLVQKDINAGTEKVELEFQNGTYLLAKPLKALADIVAIHNPEWKSLKSLIKSLNISYHYLESVSRDDFIDIQDNYTQPDVLRFLEEVRKELSY